MLLASSKRARNSTTAVTCLPLLHRLHQRADDPRVAARAIKRLLDRQHAAGPRAACSRNSTTRVKILVGMMQQNVALADGGEQIGLVRATPRPAGATNGGSRNSGE